MDWYERPMMFALLADVQYAAKPSEGGRHYAAAKERLAECIAVLNAQQPGPAFVMQLGDLIDGGPNAQDELATATAIYHQVRMPAYHVIGNHDFEGLRRETTMSLLKLQQAYYTFEVDRRRFVVLDTQDVAVQGGWAEDSQPYRQAVAMLNALRQRGVENAQPYNGAVGAEQMSWLEEVLTEADAEKMPVLMFGHLPLVPFGDKYTLWNAEQVVAMMERHACVKAYFCGHTHRGNWLRQNGINYVSLEAMVEHADQKAVWYTVRLGQGTMDVEAVGVAQHWSLPLQENNR
jgi:3',5'-cyclic AMP phosphodiesterase CpdA